MIVTEIKCYILIFDTISLIIYNISLHFSYYDDNCIFNISFKYCVDNGSIISKIVLIYYGVKQGEI